MSISEGKAAVQKVADQYFAPDVQTRQEYIDSVAAQINVFLTIVYALLVLAIIIALFGIANTLSLSVYERIRELGFAPRGRARRSQMRSMVRWESVIIAVFGTIGGILLGLFLGWGILEVTARLAGLPGAVHDPVRSAHRRADRRRRSSACSRAGDPRAGPRKLDILQAIASE